MKLAQRQQGDSSSKRRLGGTGKVEALGRKPAEHVEYDGDMSTSSPSIPAQRLDTEPETYLGKSDGEILARYEF